MFKISLISLFIVVGSSSSEPYLVFIDALSASSSIKINGRSILPFLKILEFWKYFFKLFKTYVFFLITATTGFKFFSSLKAILWRAGVSKSNSKFVTEKGLGISWRASYFGFTNPSSILCWVCLLRVLSRPAITMMTF